MKVLRNLQHRVRFPQTKAYQQHLQSTEKLIHSLESKYPFLNFDLEKESIRNGMELATAGNVEI